MHFVAALDTCPRCAASSPCSRAWPPARPTATPAWPAARPPPCCTSGPAWATAWPTCTTPAGPRARSSTSSATTPRTTSSTTPRSSPTSRRSARNVSRWVRCVGRRRPTSAGTPPRPWPSASGPPGQVATLILPGRRVAGPTAAGRRADPAPSARRPSTRDTVEVVAKALRSGEPLRLPARRLGAAGRRAARRQPGRRRHRRQAAGRDVPDPPRARRRAAADRAARLPGRVRRDAARRPAPPGAGRRQGAGVASSPTPARPATSCPTAARSTCWPSRRRRRGRRARGAGRAPSAPPPTAPRCSPPSRPELPTGDARPPTTVAAGRRRAAARGRHRVRRGATRRACSPPALTAGAPRHDWLTPHRRRHRPGHAGRHRRRRRLPRPQGGEPRRPTAAPCTRSRRCGPRPASGSTSSRSSTTTGRYAILNMELDRVGAEAAGAEGARACSTCPAPTSTSWRSPQGLGVPATRATTADELSDQLARALAEPGPAPHRGDRPLDPLTPAATAPAPGGQRHRRVAT